MRTLLTVSSTFLVGTVPLQEEDKSPKAMRSTVPVQECVLCGRRFADLLKHLRLAHEIDSVEAYTRMVSGMEELDAKRGRFRKYVQELEASIKEGILTREEYRRLIMEWKDK